VDGGHVFPMRPPDTFLFLAFAVQKRMFSGVVCILTVPPSGMCPLSCSIFPWVCFRLFISPSFFFLRPHFYTSYQCHLNPQSPLATFVFFRTVFPPHLAVSLANCPRPLSMMDLLAILSYVFPLPLSVRWSSNPRLPSEDINLEFLPGGAAVSYTLPRTCPPSPRTVNFTHLTCSNLFACALFFLEARDSSLGLIRSFFPVVVRHLIQLFNLMGSASLH